MRIPPFLNCAPALLILTVLTHALPAQRAPSSPWAGQWAGTYAHSNGVRTQEGTLVLSVSENGQIVGTGLNANLRPFLLVGHVHADGALQAAFRIVDGPASFGGPIAGTLTIDGAGHLVATYVLGATGTTFHGGFDLAPL